MATCQFNRLFHETAGAAGLTKPVTLHSLRHILATHLLEHGIDIRTIQALLGHNKLDATARYTRVATGMIADIVSPLDQLLHPIKRTRRRKTAATMSGSSAAVSASVATSCRGDGEPQAGGQGRGGFGPRVAAG